MAGYQPTSTAAVPIGAHCSQQGCGQLDFLPFKCDKCQRIYCMNHHKFKEHDCSWDPDSKNIMPQCPVCTQYVYVKVDSSADVVMNAHLSSNCRSHLLSSHRDKQRSALSAATKCDQPTGCRNVEKYSTVICSKCGGQFCLSHRLPVTHRCAAAQPSSSSSAAASAEKHSTGNALLARLKEKREAKEAEKAAHAAQHAAQYPTSGSSSSSSSAVNKNKPAGFVSLQQIRAGINAGAAATMNAISSVIPGASPSPPPAAAAASSSSPPPAAAAAAVPLRPLALTTALKRSAIGDQTIAENLRVYLQVDVTAIKSKKAPVLCFFSSRHSIGKILDVICDAAGIENENHLPAGKKLYVCAPRIGATFPTDMTLGVLEGALLNGDTITLQRQPLTTQA